MLVTRFPHARPAHAAAVLLAAAALLVAPGVAHALTAAATSAPDTLDSKAPVVAVVYPAGGEVFHGTETETLTWTIAEDSWDGAATPVTVRVLDGAVLLDEQTVSPDPDGSYELEWTVTDISTINARVVVSAADRFGWAGTDTSAVFEIQDSLTDAPPAPLADRLGPVVPNPFNPLTTVRFSLRAAANVRLSVYDMRGHEIARLTDGQWPAGEHGVQWHGCDDDGAPVSSGAYFARLSIRNAGPAGRDDDMVTRLTLVR